MFKIVHSVVNVFAAGSIASLISLVFGMKLWHGQLLAVAIFFMGNLGLEHRYGKCLGMMFCGTQYVVQRNTWEKLPYIFLYTTSFSTLVCYVWFPLDLFLINFLVFQVPCYRKTGNTFHGWLGGMQTAYAKKISSPVS